LAARGRFQPVEMVVPGLGGARLGAEQARLGDLVVDEEQMAAGAYALSWLRDAAPDHARALGKKKNSTISSLRIK
jgi:hypothetical protein